MHTDRHAFFFLGSANTFRNSTAYRTNTAANELIRIRPKLLVLLARTAARTEQILNTTLHMFMYMFLANIDAVHNK